MMASSSSVVCKGVSLPVRSTARRSTVARSNFLGAPVARSFVAPRVQNKFVVRAEAETKETEAFDADVLVKDLQEKWDKIENKSTVAIYAGGAVVTIWLSGTVVSAVNAVPLLPKLLELVGLGYSAWFVYRYLLFKSSREELLQDIEELKKKITGTDK